MVFCVEVAVTKVKMVRCRFIVCNQVRTPIPVSTKHLYNICTTSDQRRRLWADVVQMFCKCFVFTVIIRILHFNPWSLDLLIRVPFQLHGEHTVLQPFRRIELIVHMATSVLLPGTVFHLSHVKHLKVKCLTQLEGKNMIFL